MSMAAVCGVCPPTAWQQCVVCAPQLHGSSVWCVPQLHGSSVWCVPPTAWQQCVVCAPQLHGSSVWYVPPTAQLVFQVLCVLTCRLVHHLIHTLNPLPPSLRRWTLSLSVRQLAAGHLLSVRGAAGERVVVEVGSEGELTLRVRVPEGEERNVSSLPLPSNVFTPVVRAQHEMNNYMCTCTFPFFTLPSLPPSPPFLPPSLPPPLLTDD